MGPPSSRILVRALVAEARVGLPCEEGAAADLILLSANPLEDIRNMQNPEGVMVRGQWLDRAFLDNKLAEIEAKYKNE